MLPAPLPTTTSGKCPNCGQSLPCGCGSTAIIDPFAVPLPFTFITQKNKDDEILAELREIRELLEAIRAEIS